MDWSISKQRELERGEGIKRAYEGDIEIKGEMI